MTKSSIITQCPCCDSEVIVDLNTGDIFAELGCVDSIKPSLGTGLQVVHATPEYFQYRDPTHHRAEPLLQPITHPVQKIEDDDEAVHEPASPELTQRTNHALNEDLKKRNLLPRYVL